ncbi:tRNA (adenosine(37)-N6)-threonylcarbamoyltransferase complex dimerization subunit type 1 TsaB [Brucepastera parasyntrophica]|uniref:tRNA (adenosine(37)-N6)-threonylcarbamoyltransferase complex dimerization subunit type 1 TsaB n=1 Tax=Brucepastera parasyntrophica TaxID=2880008 RepID=UPI00210AE078|nr:tRNA (adenosine(37)-N6)-threonylcarbamoyltransferase complex dimerization subunit type 1 TsaB [Brucepastera parasyntrophica]ULQ59755.1 tRNA (adenosine(37)-N6)-threonylcarbamoyltransferase complex dimerization subunit type 1 TsaB [Brucepastera parasyntrophica]
MNIISIDTITGMLSVSALGPKGQATVLFDFKGHHAEYITDALSKAVDSAGFSPEKTELVVCAEGPGSFTGLRIGFSAAKAVQLAAGCPLFPIQPLVCYAYPFSSWPGAVISVLDAKKGRFYVQIFRQGQPTTEALDISEKEIFPYIDPAERLLITGPDAALFAERLGRENPKMDIFSCISGTKGISLEMALMAESLYNDEKKIPDHAGPVYVRKSDAENSIPG